MKRILVGLGEAADSSSATQYAVDLAQRFDSRITAIGIVDLIRLRNVGPVPVGGGEAAREMRKNRYEQAAAMISNCTDDFVETCQAADVRYTVRRETGAAIPTLIETARYHDLLICGLGGMFEHGVINEPREELRHIIESGIQPLFAVAPDFRKIKRVLVAYSGSVESARTMRSFAEMNMYPTANLKIVHFESTEADGAKLLSDAQAYFAAHGIETQIELVRGPSQDGLLAFANDWKADLIVAGNSGKSLIRRRVFGETALAAMRSSPVPLFLGQ